MSCSSGRVGVGYEGDTCSFTCNTGYELTGSDTRACQSDGSWSGNDDDELENTGSWSEGLPSCVPLNCSEDNLPIPANAIVLQLPSCGLAYQSQCTVSCDEGFTGDDVTYLCNVTSDPTMVDWVAINSTANHTCQGGSYSLYNSFFCVVVISVVYFLSLCI